MTKFQTRRFPGHVPRIVGREPSDYAQELQEWMEKTWKQVNGGIPAGFNNIVAHPVVANAGSAGTELAGWAAADHEHDGRHNLLDGAIAQDTAAVSPSLGAVIVGNGTKWVKSTSTAIFDAASPGGCLVAEALAGAATSGNFIGSILYAESPNSTTGMALGGYLSSPFNTSGAFSIGGWATGGDPVHNPSIGLVISAGSLGNPGNVSAGAIVLESSTLLLMDPSTRIYDNFIVARDENGNQTFKLTTKGVLVLSRTITPAGTTGAQTIDKPSGTVNIAAGGTTVTVTNSLVTANSIVHCVLRTADATAWIKNVVPGAGSFVISLGAAATAEVSIGFLVTN